MKFPSTLVAALALTFAFAPALSAKIVTKPVAYEHDGVQLEGYLSYDDQKTSNA